MKIVFLFLPGRQLHDVIDVQYDAEKLIVHEFNWNPFFRVVQPKFAPPFFRLGKSNFSVFPVDLRHGH
jgi:hypothetical protein